MMKVKSGRTRNMSQAPDRFQSPRRAPSTVDKVGTQLGAIQGRCSRCSLSAQPTPGGPQARDHKNRALDRFRNPGCHASGVADRVAGMRSEVQTRRYKLSRSQSTLKRVLFPRIRGIFGIVLLCLLPTLAAAMELGPMAKEFSVSLVMTETNWNSRKQEFYDQFNQSFTITIGRDLVVKCLKTKTDKLPALVCTGATWTTWKDLPNELNDGVSPGMATLTMRQSSWINLANVKESELNLDLSFTIDLIHDEPYRPLQIYTEVDNLTEEKAVIVAKPTAAPGRRRRAKAKDIISPFMIEGPLPQNSTTLVEQVKIVKKGGKLFAIQVDAIKKVKDREVHKCYQDGKERGRQVYKLAMGDGTNKIEYTIKEARRAKAIFDQINGHLSPSRRSG